ncbi:MAG: exodeoxyribonuclease VII small subunit [Flavobacteriia bacterium]|jgi:exodeoxyribonuclease VII small subunit|nr:exodeoxyribonuclease VII small subunit [Flavobacteriia bacterium]
MDQLTYQAAFEELQEIVTEMERGTIGIDALSVKVKRAAELIQFCKQKLKETELDVDQILRDMENENPDLAK